MKDASPSRGALWALAAMVLIWAYSWIVMKQVLRYAGPFDFAAIRYLSEAVVLFALLVAVSGIAGGARRGDRMAVKRS